jgi:hypothetical protein
VTINGGMHRAAALIFMFLIGAAEPADRIYTTEYIITDQVDDSGLQTDALKWGDEVFRQRLRFAHLAVADAAVVDAGGAELLPAGQQFFKMATGGQELWCTANIKMPKGYFMNVVIGRVYSQYCILDSDKDGVFDGFFSRQRNIEQLPNIQGTITATPRPIKPLQLKEVDPASLQSDYYIGIAFSRAVGKGKTVPVFQTFAKSELGVFTMDVYSGAAIPNQILEIGTARIRVTATGDGFSAKVVRPFSSVPLKIVGQDCGLLKLC